ncbi:MAG: protein-L-isoaspartate(D-aspartate) O-methyltransferase [Fervidicoccaceae archaeon]|jgi:protein-L-isoaspartate(D-aspartate) O-methyltransferase
MVTKLLPFERKKRILIENLKKEGILKSKKVEEAIMRVPRELFVPEEYIEYAYFDEPLPIGFGQTISAPHMVVIMTEELDPEIGWKVLEVGTGSGYQASVIAEIVAPKELPPEKWGHVYTIERIEALAKRAKINLERAGYADRVTVIVGDGTLGYPEASPYDGIIVTAGAPKIPDPLINQLKIGGRIVIPIGDRYFQRLYVVEKTETGLKINIKTPCVFVPLVGKEGFEGEER